MKETITSAFTSIFANRMRSFLTVLGIVIGVMSVILLIAMVTGLKTYITGQIQGLGSNLLFVIQGRIGGARSPGGVQANRMVYSDAVNLRNKLQNEAEVSVAIQRNATLKYGNKNDKGVAVFGVESNYPKLISIKILKGRFFKESEQSSNRKVAVIGLTVESNLFGEANAIGKLIDVAGQRYTVIGVLDKRGSIFGIDQDNGIYIPFTTAQKQFGNKPGAVLTFDLGSKEECFRFINGLTLIRRATNLQDNRTLILHPASTIFCEYTEAQKREMGIEDTTIRLALGIEDGQDLIADIQQSLEAL